MKKHARPTSMKARMDSNRSLSDRFADYMSNFFGSPLFLWSNFFLFLTWILWNLKIIPGVPVFDPYPFGFLTMAVSLEAIFLSIFVLISQNRAEKIADIREEVDLQINIRAEREVTRLLIMLDEIHKAMGLKTKNSRVLKAMEKNTNLKKLAADITKEMAN